MSKYSNSVPNRSYTKPSSLDGYKCMSRSSSPSIKSSGKMSGAHGTNSGNPSKGMQNASGRIGASSKRFSSGIPANTGGPKKLS